MTAVYPSRFGNDFAIVDCLVRRIGLFVPLYPIARRQLWVKSRSPSQQMAEVLGITKRLIGPIAVRFFARG